MQSKHKLLMLWENFNQTFFFLIMKWLKFELTILKNKINTASHTNLKICYTLMTSKDSVTSSNQWRHRYYVLYQDSDEEPPSILKAPRPKATKPTKPKATATTATATTATATTTKKPELYNERAVDAPPGTNLFKKAWPFLQKNLNTFL